MKKKEKTFLQKKLEKIQQQFLRARTEEQRIKVSKAMQDLLQMLLEQEIAKDKDFGKWI